MDFGLGRWLLLLSISYTETFNSYVDLRVRKKRANSNDFGGRNVWREVMPKRVCVGAW